MPKPNKFGFIQEVAQSRKSDLNEKLEPQEVLGSSNSNRVDTESELAQPQDQSPLAFASIKRVGRPRGKRSNPDYEQVTAYIRKETHLAVKIALLQEGQGREFSELLQDLLDEFLSTQISK